MCSTHTYVLKANLLSDSCRSEAHLSNVTSPRQEKTPAIDSAESPDVAFGITLQKKHACLTHPLLQSRAGGSGRLEMGGKINRNVRMITAIVLCSVCAHCWSLQNGFTQSPFPNLPYVILLAPFQSNPCTHKDDTQYTTQMTVNELQSCVEKE